MTTNIQRIHSLRIKNDPQRIIVFFVPWKLRDAYLRELFGVKNDEELWEIKEGFVLVDEVPELPGVRAEIITYNGLIYAFIDPERIQYPKSNEVHNP